MNQSNQSKLGSESWKRMSAILLVAVMVLMVAMPMVSVAEERTVPEPSTSIGETPASIPMPPNPLATTLFYDDFSSDLGWTYGTNWERGTAAVSPGGTFNPDPANDHTPTGDNMLAGSIIGGNVGAPEGLHPYYYITSPVIDCSYSIDVNLEFWRWANTDYTSYMKNVIEVWNGGSWSIIWETFGSGTQPTDSSWTFCQYDVTGLAAGVSNFQFRIGYNVGSGGVFTVSGWNIDDVKISTSATTVTHSFPFLDGFEDGDSSDWILNGANNDWEIGTPSGLGGDPIGAHSGTYSIGNDLTGLGAEPGKYENNVPDNTNYIVSPAVNCSGQPVVILEFDQWLGVENAIWDHAKVFVSNDNGASWNNVWNNVGDTMIPDSWTHKTYDISVWAANEPNVRVRFDMGSSDDTVMYCGWNIDNVEISAPAAHQIVPVAQSATGYYDDFTYYPLTVHNNNAISDVYDLTVANNAWAVTFWNAAGTAQITNTGTVKAGNNFNFIARVYIPAFTDGMMDKAEITATSGADPSESDMARLVTTSLQPYGVNIGPSPQAEFANSGEIAIYTLTIENTGVLDENFDLSQNGGAWPVQFWNMENNPIWSTGLIPAGGSVDILATVQVPPGLPPGQFDTEIVRATSQIDVTVWDDANLITNAEPKYWFNVGPPAQTNFGWLGDWVEHRVQITNQGTEPDVYLPMFSQVGGPDQVAEWWTQFYTVDLRPQGIYNGIDDGSQTWWWGPVEPGQTKEYAIKVFVPTNTPGAFDKARITITSNSDASVVRTVDITTRTSLPTPFYDDFETAGASGVFGRYNDGGPLGNVNNVWTTNEPNMAGVNMDTSYSGIYSMYTRWGEVTTTSCMINTMDDPELIASCLIRRGGPGFSETPDTGEDLVVEYIDSVGVWHELDRFTGFGTPGEVYTPLYQLPADANHPRFQLRFRQLDGSGADSDYWHIDDVYIGAPPPSNFNIWADQSTMYAGPGDMALHDMHVQNNGVLPIPEFYDLTFSDSDWLAGALFLQDDFNDGNYNGWTVVDEGTISTPSNWGVNAGRLRQTNNIYTYDGQKLSGTYLLNGQMAMCDYTIETELMSSDNDGIGLMGRYTDQNNYYRFHWSRDGAWDKDMTKPGLQRRVLDVCVDGEWSVLASDDVYYNQNQWYDVQMRMYDDSIQVLIDGELIFDVTDDSHVNGQAGLYVWGNTGAYFDDVFVYALAEYQPITIGPLLPGETFDFQAVMQVPGDATIGDWGTIWVIGTSQLTGVMENTAITTVIPAVHNLDEDTWHPTIQDGVDMATSGDTLYVYPGTYNDYVVIDRPVIITGADKATTIIDGGVFEVRSDNVEIREFTFQNSGSGVYLFNSEGCTIHDNIFSNVDSGITTFRSSNNEFHSNLFKQCMNGSIYSELNSLYDTNFQDNFAANSGAWAYYGNAVRTNGYVQLTSNGGGQVGRILYNTPITSNFVAEFDFQAGGGNGADGMAMFFYKEAYTPAGGGMLGCVDADGTSLGYAVEFDNYPNAGESGRHIAITEDNIYNHLVSVDDQRVEDFVWHHVKVISDENGIAVFVDDMFYELIQWSGTTDRTFGGFGFSAGTGGLNNYHRVDNVEISYMLPVGNNIHDNVFINNFVGILAFSSGGNTVTNNLFENSFVNVAYAGGSTNSMAYHNDFITGPATMINVMDMAPGNFWDNGYPSGGNYWSDYMGVDIFNGALQNIPGSDNIGDTPYVVPASGGMDNYPQINRQIPLSSPGDIALLNSIPGNEDSFAFASELTAYIDDWNAKQIVESDGEEIIEMAEPPIEDSESISTEPVPQALIEEVQPESVIEETVIEPVVQEEVSEPEIQDSSEDSVVMAQEDVQPFNFPWSILMVVALVGAVALVFRRKN